MLTALQRPSVRFSHSGFEVGDALNNVHCALESSALRCAGTAWWGLLQTALHRSGFEDGDTLNNVHSALESSALRSRRDRVVGPILQLKDELFQTFRQRRSIVSVQEYETDKASLERMLADFESDFAKLGQARLQRSHTPCSHGA